MNYENHDSRAPIEEKMPKLYKKRGRIIRKSCFIQVEITKRTIRRETDKNINQITQLITTYKLRKTRDHK